MLSFFTASHRNCFFMLQALDVVSTLLAFYIKLPEANPILRAFFPVFGPVLGLIIGKLITALMVYWFVTTRVHVRWTFVNLLGTLVVLWNVIGASLKMLAQAL